MITAAVDILGGVGADYLNSGKCNNGPPAAFLKMHGVKDPFITYDRQVGGEAHRPVPQMEAGTTGGTLWRALKCITCGRLQQGPCIMRL